MRIAVIGTGYVGLVSGACFSEFGLDVVCVDKDAAKIAGLKAGKMPIYEPGLEALVANNVHANRLSFSTDLKSVGQERRCGLHRRGHALAPRRRPCRSFLCP